MLRVDKNTLLLIYSTYLMLIIALLYCSCGANKPKEYSPSYQKISDTSYVINTYEDGVSEHDFFAVVNGDTVQPGIAMFYEGILGIAFEVQETNSPKELVHVFLITDNAMGISNVEGFWLPQDRQAFDKVLKQYTKGEEWLFDEITMNLIPYVYKLKIDYPDGRK